MKTLYESILSSTGTGKTVIIKDIEKRNFTPDVIKTLNKTVAIYPVTDDNIKDLVTEYINAAGNECSLNWIDVSNVTDMSSMFYVSDFNGNISKWDVSNVRDMSFMFCGAKKFNQSISDWDVSNVKDMYGMFYGSVFNGNISKWDVSNVKNMGYMFYKSVFNGNISKWDVSNVKKMNAMFEGSNFNGNISKWNVQKVKNYFDIFNNCPISPDYKPKFN